MCGTSSRSAADLICFWCIVEGQFKPAQSKSQRFCRWKSYIFKATLNFKVATLKFKVAKFSLREWVSLNKVAALFKVVLGNRAWYTITFTSSGFRSVAPATGSSGGDSIHGRSAPQCHTSHLGYCSGHLRGSSMGISRTYDRFLYKSYPRVGSEEGPSKASTGQAFS